MDIQNFYENAEHGHKSFQDNNRHLLALQFFSDLNIKSIVDFGCGDGSFLKSLKEIKPDLEAVGLEISQSTIDKAACSNINIKLIRHDFNKSQSSLETNSFDACFMGELIEHVFSPDDLLREARRIVKPGGYLFLTTPNLASWFNRASLLFGYQPIFTEVSAEANAGHIINLTGHPAGHIRMFTYRALKEVIERNEWKIEKAIGIGLNVGSHKGPKYIYKLLNFIFSSPKINSGIGILARKI